MDLENKNSLIICVCGKARSGKSLVAEYIRDYFVAKGKKVIISPYTKYLKKYINEVTGWDMNDLEKPRDLLQNLSSELIKKRLQRPNFFIDRQIEDIDFYSYFFDVIIIPDVRFEREINCLKERYERVCSVGVIRENYDNGLSLEQKNDLTEISLDGYRAYDCLIYNNTKEKLYDDTINFLKSIN